MEESSCKLNDAAIGLTEMMYLKRQQQSSVDAAKRPCLGRQVLLTSSPICAQDDNDAAAHIKVGSYYEIDHTKLSSKNPDQLNSIRVVMVREKSKGSVSLRFPSIYSLREHLSDGNPKTPEGKKLPPMDEKYAMRSELAGEVLYRRIPPHEIAVQRNSWSFWVMPSMAAEKEKISSPPINVDLSNVESNKGSCWSELKCIEMVKWGQRRQVRFVGSSAEEKCEQSLSNNVRGEEDKGDEGKQEHEEEEEEEMEVDDEEAAKAEQPREIKKNLKRKRLGPSSRTQRAKSVRRDNQYQINFQKHSKKKLLKNSIDRWSVERYKLAEENMLKILKEKGSVFGNPILRPALRSEARRLIGDTGLLDHLLKHMSGKVAPGGKERFRRRHNADGAMEYWLESADLVNIRKEAGVQDPYWTPPPGWKLGDNPTQDPICALELKKLKEEIAKMKSDMQEMVSKKQEEDLAIVTNRSSLVTTQNLEHESSLLPLKETYIDLVNRKAKIEEQLMEISLSLCQMEEEMGTLKSTVKDPKKPKSAAATPLLLMGSTPPSGTERETKEVEQKNKEAETVSGKEQEDGEKSGGQAPTPTPTIEDKAAKIERLKSGFRICRPQGSFLWPNMAMSPQVVVQQFEDLLVVPTPPSVSSSTTSAPHLVPLHPQHGPHPDSPIKPLAEWRPVPITLHTAVARHHPPPPPPPPPPTPPLETTTQYKYSTTTTTTTRTTDKSSLINLNEVPNDMMNDNGFCGSHRHSTQSSPSRITYQRRHHNVTATVPMPHMEHGEKEEEMNEWEGGERNEILRNGEQQQRRGCSSSSSSSCLTVGVGTWLALATTHNLSSNNDSRRG